MTETLALIVNIRPRSEPDSRFNALCEQLKGRLTNDEDRALLLALDDAANDRVVAGEDWVLDKAGQLLGMELEYDGGTLKATPRDEAKRIEDLDHRLKELTDYVQELAAWIDETRMLASSSG